MIFVMKNVISIKLLNNQEKNSVNPEKLNTIYILIQFVRGLILITTTKTHRPVFFFTYHIISACYQTFHFIVCYATHITQTVLLLVQFRCSQKHLEYLGCVMHGL